MWDSRETKTELPEASLQTKQISSPASGQNQWTYGLVQIQCVVVMGRWERGEVQIGKLKIVTDSDLPIYMPLLLSIHYVALSFHHSFSPCVSLYSHHTHLAKLQAQMNSTWHLHELE